ncbi:hypothetical protein Tco_1554260 [Tanacetum coccineum]
MGCGGEALEGRPMRAVGGTAWDDEAIIQRVGLEEMRLLVVGSAVRGRGQGREGAQARARGANMAAVCCYSISSICCCVPGRHQSSRMKNDDVGGEE